MKTKTIAIIAILSLFTAGCELLPFNVDNAVNKAAQLGTQAQASNAFLTTVETLTGSSQNQVELHKQRKEGLDSVIGELSHMYEIAITTDGIALVQDRAKIIEAIVESYDKHTTNESVLSIILIVLGIVVLAMIYLLTRGINNFIKNRRSNQKSA